jgi:hypothetical protein
MSEHCPKPTKIATTRDSTAGRVETDARGRNVWRWKKTGASDSTSVLLKRLDNDALQLEPTGRVRRPGSPEPKQRTAPLAKGAHDARSDARAGAAGRSHVSASAHPKPTRGKGGGGFDPYNSSR